MLLDIHALKSHYDSFKGGASQLDLQWGTCGGMVNWVYNCSILWLVIGIQCLVTLGYGRTGGVEGQHCVTLPCCGW